MTFYQWRRAIANTGDLFRDSSTLALRPRLQHLKDFHYKPIPPDHSVPQHLQLSDSLVRTHRKPHKLAEDAPQTKSSHTNSKHREHTCPPPQRTKKSLWWSQHFDHLKTISLQHSYRMNNQWMAQVFVWENKERDGGGKLKESLLILLIKTLLLIGNICS